MNSVSSRAREGLDEEGGDVLAGDEAAVLAVEDARFLPVPVQEDDALGHPEGGAGIVA